MRSIPFLTTLFLAWGCIDPVPKDTSPGVDESGDSTIHTDDTDDTDTDDTDTDDTDTDDTDTDEPPTMQDRIGACDIFDASPVTTPEELAIVGAEDLPVLQSLGMGVARPHRLLGHVFSMQVVVPTGDLKSEDWTLPDAVVQAAGAAGVGLYVTLDNTVNLEVQDGLSIPIYVPPEQLTDWSTWVEHTVERYDGDGIDDMPGLVVPVFAYEVGNEPFCGMDDTGCQNAYLELVRTSWEAGHRADPKARILVGGARPLYFNGITDLSAQNLYLWFFEKGGAEFTDAFPFHVLTGETEPTVDVFVDGWRRIVGEEELWLTETGVWKTGGDNPLASDPEAAATWLVSHLDQAFDVGITRILVCKSRHSFTEPTEVHDALEGYIRSLEK